jgi:hypothetical protein
LAVCFGYGVAIRPEQRVALPPLPAAYARLLVRDVAKSGAVGQHARVDHDCGYPEFLLWKHRKQLNKGTV